jgi:hypothetical protein
MGKLTISMAIFNSYVKLPEGNHFFTSFQDFLHFPSISTRCSPMFRASRRACCASRHWRCNSSRRPSARATKAWASTSGNAFLGTEKKEDGEMPGILMILIVVEMMDS